MNHTEDHEDGGSGLSRRDMLRRGAIVGGAAVWMTPAMEVLGVGRRFAQAASGGPPPTDPPKPTTTTTLAEQDGIGLSYVAFRFVCGGKVYYAKLEGDTLAECEGPNKGNNDCGVDRSGAANGCGLFTTVNTFKGTEVNKVVVTLTCIGGTFVSAAAKAGKKCISASISGNVAILQI